MLLRSGSILVVEEPALSLPKGPLAASGERGHERRFHYGPLVPTLLF